MKVSSDEPDVSLLSAKELEAINETLERLSSMNATQISAYSHSDIPWKVTEDKEIIEYELVFYRDPLISVKYYPFGKSRAVAFHCLYPILCEF